METNDCQCEKCIDLCKYRPCWGTPDEIKKIIESGFGKRLMLDYWGDNYKEIKILCPALKGSENQDSPFFPLGICTFLTTDNKCEIHSIKPAEGRVHFGCGKDSTQELSHGQVARLWDNDEAQQVVSNWVETKDASNNNPFNMFRDIINMVGELDK